VTNGSVISRTTTQHPRQGHFRVSSLKAALHRRADQELRVGIAHTLVEEIGIATELLRRREGDLIDAVLDRDLARGRNAAIR
jgi:hypothetical protein